MEKIKQNNKQIKLIFLRHGEAHGTWAAAKLTSEGMNQAREASHYILKFINSLENGGPSVALFYSLTQRASDTKDIIKRSLELGNVNILLDSVSKDMSDFGGLMNRDVVNAELRAVVKRCISLNADVAILVTHLTTISLLPFSHKIRELYDTIPYTKPFMVSVNSVDDIGEAKVYEIGENGDLISIDDLVGKKRAEEEEKRKSRLWNRVMAFIRMLKE